MSDSNQHVKNEHSLGQARSRVYVWFDSEGWIRLGPFEYVAVKNGVLETEIGLKIVDLKNGNRMLIEKYHGYQVNHLEITGSEMHPSRVRPGRCAVGAID